MNDILEKSTVLVLNRHWQAIAARTPADAFAQMMTGAACGLDIDSADGTLAPVRTWRDWLALPVRPSDRFARTVRGAVRVPTVLVLARYAAVPRRRPALERARHLGARRPALPVHGPAARPGRRQHRPRRAPLARRGDLLGELRLGVPAGQQPQGRPAARGSRPAPFARAQRPARAAGQRPAAQQPRHRRLGTVSIEPGDAK